MLDRICRLFVFVFLIPFGESFAEEPPTGLSQEFLDLSLEPPEINTSPGSEYADDRRTFNMIIGMDQTPNGRIWACWCSGGDSQDGYFVAATSDNQGLTWSAPRLVIDPSDPPGPVKRRTLVGNFWTDPKGRLWLFFDQSMGYFDGRSGVWATVCDNPDSDVPTWSKPRRIWHGSTLNKPIVLKNGEWLLPISLWTRDHITQEPLKELYHDLDDQRMAHVFVSSDAGETWTRRGGTRFPGSEFDEHMLVELNDGRLWMLARTNYGGIGESFSTDGGRTWSLTQPSFLRQPSARFFIRRLRSGKLLLVKHGRPDERTRGRSHLSAYLSEDDGRTWIGGLMLDERSKVSYPDGFEAPDGTIYILYDYNRSTSAEILLAKFHEADVLAGRFMSPGSKPMILVNKARGAAPVATPSVETWELQAIEDAKQDRTTIAFDGQSPNKLVCDTTLRQAPDGSWVLVMLAGGDKEPSPENYTALTRSTDEGRTWSKLEPVNVGFPRSGSTSGQGPTELMVYGDRCTLFYGTHARHWNTGWRSWMMTSDDSCRTWSGYAPAPGRLRYRTFLRDHIVTRDGRVMVPFQHYIGLESEFDKTPLERTFCNPRNGVIVSSDGGRTWNEHGNIRLSENDRYFGWAENNIVEFANGHIGMIIRADRLGGVLYYAESADGGRTWPEFAHKTDIPNPGSKATLYPLGGDSVALLHNPNPSQRSPLALWISFDAMKTWPYRRVLVPESCDGPTGRLNYPDGFVSRDKQWLHFAFDDNRHRGVYYGARLPPLP
ncbi:MAG TPA: sialidase family protein [Pirellulales bacterium]|nr:sialidase family protein [Pirellulales bacterium]